MNAWIWKNNTFQRCDSVPLTDRGFRYGMSVFESFPVQDGAVFFLKEHFEKLCAAAKQCRFSMPEIPLTAISSLAETLIGKHFARIYVTAGDGAPTANRDRCRVYFFEEKREFPSAEIYARGYRIAISETPYQPIFQPQFGGFKTANYWQNIEPNESAKSRGFDEALLLNANGEAVSASMANLFIVKNGVILTSPLASGARAGVIRDWVFRQRKVTEISLTANDIKNADEIFLTSSWLGVMPVCAVEDRGISARNEADNLREVYNSLRR